MPAVLVGLVTLAAFPVAGCVAQGLRSHVTSSCASCWCEQLYLLISSRCLPLVHAGCHDALLAHLGVMYCLIFIFTALIVASQSLLSMLAEKTTAHVWCECVGSSVLNTLSTHTHTHTHSLTHRGQLRPCFCWLDEGHG
jgi:hypothetical protein